MATYSLKRGVSRILWSGGWLALVTFFWIFRNQKPADLQRRSWKLVRSLSFLFRQRANFLNKFEMGWQDLTFAHILHLLGKYHPEYIIPVRISASDVVLNELQNSKEGGLVVSLHIPTIGSFPRAMENIGRKAVAITMVHDQYIQQAKRFGGDMVPETIYPSRNIFLELRRRMASGELVGGPIDYLVRLKSPSRKALFVSPSMIAFALRLKRPIYCAIPLIDDNGQLEASMFKPVGSEPEAIIAEFAEFVFQKTGVKKTWTIKTPQSQQ